MTASPTHQAPRRHRQKRILLALGWYDVRLHRGIAKYAAEHGWHLCPDSTKEQVIPWGWEGDGILAWLGAGDELAKFVVDARKPTVDFSNRRPQLPFPRVLVDLAAGARLAADYFLARGMSHFIVYTGADNWAFEENGSAFVRYVAHAGRTCKWLRWHKSPKFTRGRTQWRAKHQWLAGELKKAPKPLAVYATTDDHAVEVLEACVSCGLAVPEVVSIIGVDNSLLAVEAMQTPISSVDTNLEAVGYRGAALLDDLMQGKPAPKEPMRIPPAGLIARKSSDLIAIGHPGVARSVRYIIEHCHEPINVKTLVSVAVMSRRGLHQAFVDHLGRTPAEELHRTRIERAKVLLAKSDNKLEALARMCGYQNANTFGVAFKQSMGMSPKAYRDSLSK
jgi:LacI family transcriptional regulator